MSWSRCNSLRDASFVLSVSENPSRTVPLSSGQRSLRAQCTMPSSSNFFPWRWRTLPHNVHKMLLPVCCRGRFLSPNPTHRLNLAGPSFSATFTRVRIHIITAGQLRCVFNLPAFTPAATRSQGSGRVRTEDPAAASARDKLAPRSVEFMATVGPAGRLL